MSPAAHKPTLLLADDHTLVLEGFTRLLENDYEIVGHSHDGRSVIEDAHRLKPHMILMDISMPEITGIEAARQLRATLPGTKILVVTQQDAPGYVQEAFRAGVMGYLLKQSAAAELRTALLEVLSGHYYISPLVTQGIPPSLIRPLVNPSELFGKGLTVRQREVLRWVAEGKSVKEIANILNISPKTVEYHKAVLMEELGRHTTAELTRYAIENGIVN